MTVNRVTLLGLEIPGDVDCKARATVLGVEIVGDVDCKARATLLGLEIISTELPPLPEPPEKPTIAITDSGPDFIDLAGSAYVPGPLSNPHANTQWQVTLSADTGFATPIIDTLVSSAPLETFHAVGGLNLFLNQYIARVRYQNDYGQWSEWSDNSAATGILTEGQYYTAMAERPIGTDLRADVLADWDELDISDGQSDWPITSRVDATCQVVSRRGSIDGAIDTVDPLYWQGFPSVDQQIVLARVIFDVSGTGGDACVGESDPTGLICKEHSGLVAYTDFESDTIDLPPSEWRIIRGGISTDDDHAGWRVVAGDGHYGADPPAYGSSKTKCLRFQRHETFPATQIIAQIAWEDGGEFDHEYIVQGWLRNSDHAPYWQHSRSGIFSGLHVDYPQVPDWPYLWGKNEHLCGLLQTWVFNQGLWKDEYLVWTDGTFNLNWGTGWEAFKMYGSINHQTLWRGGAGHNGLDPETRNSDDILSEHSGQGWCGFATDSCLNDAGAYYVEFNELSVCEANWIKFLDVPAGWLIKIYGGSAGYQGRPINPSSGTGIDYWDFRATPFPVDTIEVWGPDPEYDEPPLASFSPSDQIWGGDIYRIRYGGIGVGRIGGAAARLTGTPEGTDGSGYVAYLDDGRFLRLEKWSAAGGLVNLGSYDFPHEANKYYNIVLEATGTTIRAKVWEGGAGLQGDPENNDPLVWHIEVTDATYASGAPGIVALDATEVDFDVFATGLGGDPYPTGRYPGACTWVQPSGSVVVDPTDPVVPLEWTAPTVVAGVLGGELVYELQYQRNGASSWTPLASNVRGTTYSWNVSQLPQYIDYCVQVRAYAGCEYGPWTPICGINWLGKAKVPDGYFFGDWETGELDVGRWIRLFQASHRDDGLGVSGCLVTRELMPAGVNGECLFQKLYVTITTTTRASVWVTPILDGDYLEEERRVISLNHAQGGRETQRHEIDLTRGYGDPEKWRYGYRGSYWQVEICAQDQEGVGRIEIDGVAVRFTVVRETHPWARPFVGELEVDIERERKRRFMLGTSTADDFIASIYELEKGSTDFGERLQFFVEPNPHAPFGPSEEAWFRNLYLSFTRSNANDVTLEVTPILDGEPLETQTVTLPAVVNRVPLTDIHEVPLSVALERSGVEIGRYGARGVWFSFRIINSSQRSTGEIALNGAAVEVIPVRESEPGVT
jgi:hypothetical protein